MSRRNPADLSFDDLLQRLQRLCAACGTTAPELLANPDHFPAPDYCDETGAAFWFADTVRAWVEAYARAEILSRPQEHDELVAIVQLMQRTSKGKEPFPPAEARERALQIFVNGRIEQVVGPITRPVDDGKTAP